MHENNNFSELGGAGAADTIRTASCTSGGSVDSARNRCSSNSISVGAMVFNRTASRLVLRERVSVARAAGCGADAASRSDGSNTVLPTPQQEKYRHNDGRGRGDASERGD